MEKHQSLLDATDHQQQINEIMQYLFVYQSSLDKKVQYHQMLSTLENLDLIAHYALFSLVDRQLPHRARMLFAGETYQGKLEFLREVFAHVADLPMACSTSS